MDRANKSINIIISGKNFAGEDFRENAQLESFGSFGMLIHTTQKLRLGDVMHICGANGKPLASAEAVWVRGGETPAIEVLLHRNTDLAELWAGMKSLEEQMIAQSPPAAAAAKTTTALKGLGTGATNLLGTVSASNSGLSPSTSVSTSDIPTNSDSTETINCPSCSRANPINAKSCRFCGVYLSRGVPGAPAPTRALDTKSISANASVNASVSASANANTSATVPVPASKEETSAAPPSAPLSVPAPTAKKPTREASASPKQQRANVAERKASLETLQQYRKIAFISLVLLVIIFAVSFLSFGAATFSPTPIGIIEQKNCYEIDSLKRQVSDTTIAGEIDVWGQVNNGSIQFIRHDSSAGAAIEKKKKLTNTGLKLHGCWCQKTDIKSSTDTASALPEILNSIWVLKPTGENQYGNEYRIQYKDNVLRIKEIIANNTLERTPDIKQALYYTGVKKLVIKLGDTTANISAPTLREITFYLPSNQDTAAAADGQLSNSVRSYLTAQPNGQEGSGATLILIVRILLGALVFINIGYLVTNFSQVAKLEAS